ncbi:MAG: signal peptidase II [Gammaproteobacteria bacterium RIFCSPHIGHO2_12_FULL_35_23]|nr:MAG: signal peptidase II [Gammaproteobacteria bacterium RIFCSPHIGHO2_12_FULL_35_23]
MNAKKEKGNLRWLWLSIIVLIIDLYSKHYFYTHLVFGESVVILPVFNLTLMFNKGAAFSFLNTASGWQLWFFNAIAIIVCLFIFVWLSQIKRNRNFIALGLALVLGGALGNLFDRLWHGYVVDFIDLHIGSWHWPVFNIADSAIVIGVVILIVDAIINERHKPKIGV